MKVGRKKVTTAGIIGSFKQHYEYVLQAVRSFQQLGLNVTSPKGNSILEEGIDFVRFDTDSITYDDETIQSITLHHLFKSDFIYVVAPNGYVGRTTCYEIGRLLHAELPVYFSSYPSDLPIKLPDSHILSIEQITIMLKKEDFTPAWPFRDESLGFFGELEKEIISGKYRNK